MAVLRAFIAIDLPSPIREKLEQETKSLKNHLLNLPIRWVPTENIHLTLIFLGDVSETNVDMIAEIINTHGRQQSRFEMSIGSLGVFPNTSHPRVLWVGVEAPEELKVFRGKIASEITRLGYKIDDREYSPHLTLGRVSRNASSEEVRTISKILEKEKLGFVGVVPVAEVHLYRSDIKTGGAIYTKLFSAPLSNTGETE